MRRRPAVALLLLLTACGGPPAPAPAPTASTGQPTLPTARAQLGDVALTVELATTDAQREAGLRDREVSPGTGMAFLYPDGRAVRFTMSEVEEPLAAVFSYGGVAVSVEQLAPCSGTIASCPTYGPDTPVDLVVEAAPESVRQVRPGDPVSID